MGGTQAPPWGLPREGALSSTSQLTVSWLLLLQAWSQGKMAGTPAFLRRSSERHQHSARGHRTA
jgi:hypothetical protein